MKNHKALLWSIALTLALLMGAVPSRAATVSYLLEVNTFGFNNGVFTPPSIVYYNGGIAGPSQLIIQGTFIATISDSSIIFENIDVIPSHIGLLPASALSFNGLRFSAGCLDTFLCRGHGFLGRFDGTDFFMKGSYSDGIIVDGISYTFEMYAHTTSIIPLPSSLLLLISGLSLLGFTRLPKRYRQK